MLLLVKYKEDISLRVSKTVLIMSSKIPRLCLTPEAAKTDDEKLNEKYKGAKPKQMLKSSLNSETNENRDTSKEKNHNGAHKALKNKTDLSSGKKMVSKTVNKISKSAADFSRKENLSKESVTANVNIKPIKRSETKIFGFDKENLRKVKDERKTESNVNKTKKLDGPSDFAGIKFVPKVRQSVKPTFDPRKSMRRSKTESDLKIDASHKNGKDKFNKVVQENKPKSINQRNLELSHILSPELGHSMKNEIVQKEVFETKKDTAHRGLNFKPNSKKSSAFNFNMNKI